jgi:hypothetical protein
MIRQNSKDNAQIEPPLGRLPLMSNIEIDPVRSISLSETVPNDARLNAAVKRAADAAPLELHGNVAPPQKSSTPRRGHT